MRKEANNHQTQMENLVTKLSQSDGIDSSKIHVRGRIRISHNHSVNRSCNSRIRDRSPIAVFNSLTNPAQRGMEPRTGGHGKERSNENYRKNSDIERD